MLFSYLAVEQPNHPPGFLTPMDMMSECWFPILWIPNIIVRVLVSIKLAMFCWRINCVCGKDVITWSMQDDVDDLVCTLLQGRDQSTSYAYHSAPALGARNDPALFLTCWNRLCQSVTSKPVEKVICIETLVGNWVSLVPSDE